MDNKRGIEAINEAPGAFLIDGFVEPDALLETVGENLDTSAKGSNAGGTFRPSIASVCSRNLSCAQ